MRQISFIVRSLTALDSLTSLVTKSTDLPAVMALVGDLGSGKTAFVQSLAKSYGATQVVTSPTFTLVQEYSLTDQRQLIHADLYRLNQPHEIIELGLPDYFTWPHTVTAIEWADRQPSLIPDTALWISFEIIPPGRLITLQTPDLSLWRKLENAQNICALVS